MQTYHISATLVLMEAAHSSEMSIKFYQITLYSIPEHNSLHSHHYKYIVLHRRYFRISFLLYICFSVSTVTVLTRSDTLSGIQRRKAMLLCGTSCCLCMCCYDWTMHFYDYFLFCVFNPLWRP